MTYEEFLSWKSFIEKELEDERDAKGLLLSYLAHLSYYTYDLRFVLGGSNRFTPKDFWIELKKEPKFKEIKEELTEEELKTKWDFEKAALAAALGMDYGEIKRKHGLK